MESTPDEDTVSSVESIMEDLECYINLVDRTIAQFEDIDFNFGRSFAVGKQYYMPERNLSLKEEPISAINFIVVFF